jgi:3',5'-cyclic AMP phosphodiesterase CpdA
MRILYYSDIHIEIRESETRPYPDWTDVYPLRLGPDISEYVGTVDLVILAGDIGKIRGTRSISALLYAQQVAESVICPVVLVPGNHEYYGGSFPDDRDALISEDRPGVTVLDRGIAYFPHPAGRLRILGATLWTDYAILGDVERAMDRARGSIFDHRRIATSNGGRFRPEDALVEHILSRDWLLKCLEEPHVGPTIIVTHHVPHFLARHPHYPSDDPLVGAFCSDCSQIIDSAARSGVPAWIFGHHHHCIDLSVSGVRLLSAQTGYPREFTGWAGPGLMTL